MSDDVTTIQELLAKIQAGWDELHAFANGLTDEQLTKETDAAGWTVKDHLMHLALWENSLLVALTGGDRLADFGITKEKWAEGGDAINAVLKSRHENKSMAEVKAAMDDVHTKVLAFISAMKDADMLLPYNHFQPGDRRDAAILNWLQGNTFQHYEEHMPWMQAIARS